MRIQPDTETRTCFLSKESAVLDLSTVVLGPYASQVLAEYGADVIKIEAPEGDSTRRTGPSTEAGMGAIFLGVNRGKRSVVLDLKQAADREALCKLVDTADVLMHSIRPQKLAAIGLDPEALRKRNPQPGLRGTAWLRRETARMAACRPTTTSSRAFRAAPG